MRAFRERILQFPPIVLRCRSLIGVGTQEQRRIGRKDPPRGPTIIRCAWTDTFLGSYHIGLCLRDRVDLMKRGQDKTRACGSKHRILRANGVDLERLSLEADEVGRSSDPWI